MTDLERYYRRNLDVLLKFREANINNINTEDWFKEILDPISYKFWADWKFKPQEVSDDYFGSLSDVEQEMFRDKELRRISKGWWINTPGWAELSQEEQEYYKSIYPMAGKIQLLTGAHYTMLNYTKVPTLDKGIVNPYYFRRDAMFHSIAETMALYPLEKMENRQAMMVFKNRGSHHTTMIEGIGVAGLISRKPFSHGIALDVGKKIQKEGDKIQSVFETIPRWVLPANPSGEPVWRVRSNDQSFEIELSHFDGGPRPVFKNSMFIYNHDPRSWESKRLHRIDIDEAGICQYSILHMIGRIKPVLFNERNQIVGALTVGGTSDENNDLNNEQLTAFRDYPQNYKMFVYFCGIQHVNDIDEKGWAPEPVIIEKELAERKRILDTGDFNAYVNYVTQAPLSPEDCLYVKGTNLLDVQRISNHKKDLEKALRHDKDPNHYKILRGMFKVPSNGDIMKPEFVEDPVNGGWYICEKVSDKVRRNMGGPDNLYFAGADNVNMEITDEAADALNSGGRSSLSRQSMVVFNTYTKAPVAFYLYRHKNPTDDYFQTLLATLYYNCYIYPEVNKENQMQYIKDFSYGMHKRGTFKKWLYRRPMEFNGNWEHTQDRNKWKYGHVTGTLKVKMYERYIVPYWDKYTELVKFPQICDTFIEWNITNKKNTPDLGMAFMIALAGLEDFEKNVLLKIVDNRSNISEFYSALQRQRKRSWPGPRVDTREVLFKNFFKKH